MKVASILSAVAAFTATVFAQSEPAPLSYEEFMNATIAAHAGDVEPLILSGTVVPVGVATYTTGIRDTADGEDFCGGSLIDATHVLTAAHCTDLPIRYVSVGSHYLSGSLDGVQIAVKKMTRHPKRASTGNGYDFLILELASPVDTTKYPPVKLANPSGTDIVDGAISTALGWGTTSSGGDPSNVLLKVDLPIVSQSACARKLRIDSSMLCAGGVRNKDSCQGDSGGPLIVKGADGSDVLIGVVSWGNGCGMAGYPGVYARVPIAADWIKSIATGAKFS